MAKKMMIASADESDNNSNVKNFLSLDTIEQSVREDITIAYVEELGGYVYQRPVGADVAVAFMEEGVSRAEQIRAMARYVSESLCNEDGSEYISFERAIKLPLELIDALVSSLAIIRKRDKNDKGGKRGNVSRR